MEVAIVRSPDLLNPDVGDMLLDDGDAVLLDDISDETAQRLHVGFRFFKGEWFLDLREGVPYFDEIFADRPDDRVIRAVFGSVIRNTEGVAAVERLEYQIDNTTGRLTLSFQARLDDGSLFDSTEFGPFIVAVAN